MKYTVGIAPTFKKQQKTLAKKYPSLDDDVIAFIESLKKDPLQGISLGDADKISSTSYAKLLFVFSRRQSCE